VSREYRRGTYEARERRSHTKKRNTIVSKKKRDFSKHMIWGLGYC
jgi:hypothetical protein